MDTKTLPPALKAFVEKHQLFQQQDTLIIACSGGVDSVVLAHVLHGLGYNMLLAHCNFQLRGAESQRDEDFVRTLAKMLHVPIEVNRFDTLTHAETNRISIQESARALRYTWFEHLVQQYKPENAAAYTATAHHADDQVETILNNHFRGGGIKNFTGMPVKRQHIVRPLLFASREAIVTYAQRHQLQWVEDSSNEKINYTRNLIRRQILPAIQQVYPAVQQNILHTQMVMDEAILLYDEAVAARRAKLLEFDKDLARISILKLLQQHPLRTMVYEVFKPYDFTPAQTAELIKVCRATNGSMVMSPTHRVMRHNKWLLILPLAQLPAFAPIRIETLPASVSFAGKVMQAEQLTLVPHIDVLKATDSQTLYADASSLDLPMILRPWQAGDYLYPFGMQKKKKVARLLIDLKIPAHEKENIWVLESNKRIIWVVGIRADNRCAVKAATKSVIRLRLHEQ